MALNNILVPILETPVPRNARREAPPTDAGSTTGEGHVGRDAEQTVGSVGYVVTDDNHEVFD